MYRIQLRVNAADYRFIVIDSIFDIRLTLLRRKQYNRACILLEMGFMYEKADVRFNPWAAAEPDVLACLCGYMDQWYND